MRKAVGSHHACYSMGSQAGDGAPGAALLFILFGDTLKLCRLGTGAMYKQ